MKRMIILAVIAVVVLGGWYFWSESKRSENTDDAQIDGHVNAISSRVSGNIIKVLVEDEQQVKAGDVLAELDQRDFEVALAKAEADLSDAQASLRSAQIDVPITTVNTASQLSNARSGKLDVGAGLIGAERQLAASRARLEAAKARVAQAEANYNKASLDLKRYKELVDKDEISKQQYDAAVAAAESSRAELDSTRASVVEAEQNVVASQSGIEQAKARVAQADASIQSALTAPQQIDSKRARVEAAMAQIKQRQAAVDQAKLNLQYCTITSPVDGIVGKKTAEVGQNVTPGQQLMAVVPISNIWVTANFKETQLRKMKPGQRVEIKVDAFGKSYNGKVARVAGATGARFSLIPPENATGNYVKVVQRLPVRIELDPGQDPEHRLRVGLSVEPKVYVE